jgi:hypothetical protein
MEIRCRCGAIHVELTGKPVAQFFCHCDDCQAAHGAAYVPVSMYPENAVKVTRGNPNAWKLRTMPRRTCSECGTRVFATPPGVGLCGVSAVLLPEGAFEPSFHIQCQFAMRPVRDNLPHYKALPPEFGGSNETVDW